MGFPLLFVLVLGGLGASITSGVARADVQTLAGDADCSGGAPAPCITITSGTLNMNGHTITGGNPGVLCLGRCRINGPGTITGAVIGVNAYGNLDLRGVNVVGNDVHGVQCYTGCRAVGPASLSDNGDSGITSTGTLKLRDVTVANNGEYGALAATYRGEPPNRGKVNAVGSTFTGNAIGVSGDRAVKLKASTVTGNVIVGIEVGDTGCTSVSAPVLVSTAVTGNGTDAGCGTTVACADVMSCKAPKLGAGASCDTSYVIDTGVPGDDWDVCSSD